MGRFALFLAYWREPGREARSWLEDYGIGLVVFRFGLGLAREDKSGIEVRSFRASSLFDNCIGRKRDVGGGFLAGRRCGPDFGVS